MNKKRSLSIVLALLIVLTSFQLNFAIGLDSPTEYNMNLTLDTKSHMIYGEQLVEITNSYNSELKEIVFHLYPNSYLSYETMPIIGGMYFVDKIPEIQEEEKGWIEIEEVHINNNEPKYTTDNQILKIILEKPIKKGEKVKVKIKFKLKIPEGNHRLHHVNEEYSLTNWYPILSIYDEKTNKWDKNPYHPIGESNYSDVSNYNVKLTIPKNMVVASTGNITKEKIENESKTLEISAEKVRDFVIFMSPNYKIKSKEVDGIKISHYYMVDKDFAEEKVIESIADRILNEVAKTVKFMNTTVGKYPYDELKIAETYLAGGAMEYPQVIQMGRYYDLEDESEEYAPFTIEAAVHETMHQWWYVGVGNNEFKEPFLDESLTVFMTALYFEKEYGKYHQNGVNYQIRANFYPEKSTPINSSVADFGSWDEYSSVIYQKKGPAFFEDLRQRLGEETFTKFLRKYYEKYLFKNASIEGLIDTIEEIAGKETKNIMKKAVNDPNYYPKNIELNEDERAEIFKAMDKRDIKEQEKIKGLITRSIILRALEGEDLIVVKPNYVKKEHEMMVDNFILNIQEYFKFNYNMDIKVVEEDKLNKEDKKQNLILIGYPENHSIMKEMAKYLPINIFKDTIKIKGISVIREGAEGTFIMGNPNNLDRLVLIVFLDKEKVLNQELNGEEFYLYDEMIFKYNPLHSWGEPSQFIIDIENVEIRGMYK